MNWKRSYLFPVFATLLLAACDSFQEDLAPKGEDELILRPTVSALPNTSLYIDLKKTLQTSEVVKFELIVMPSKGQASITDESVLHYVPNQDFISGEDFLTIELINQSGVVVDSDSLFISMSASADSLPCFNGALSDYYYTEENSSLTFNPLSNDGYCPEQPSGAILDIIEDPEHGEVQQVELFTYSYTPEAGFIGSDSFMYELTLVDDEGSEYYSLAMVTIEVKEAYSHCDSLVSPFTYHIENHSEPFHIIEAFRPDPFCGSYNDYTITVLEVASGKAEVVDDHYIKYTPGSDTIDFINYKIALPTKTLYNEIMITFGEQRCLEAFDDWYELEVLDSIGTSRDPYRLGVTSNDVICGEYSLEILEQGSIGVAEVSGGLVSYYADEEFAGTMETRFKYEVCSSGACDQAWVNLTVSK